MTEPHVDSRQLGDATVTVISDGSIRVPIEWQLDLGRIERKEDIPCGPDGKERFDHLNHLIRLGDASVLVDAGMDDPSVPSTISSPFLDGLARTPGLVAGLASIGVRPEDITHVLFTHLHWDHFMGAAVRRGGRYVPRFPHACHVVHRLDWEALPRLTGDDADLQARLTALQEAGLLEIIDGDREIVPGIAMIHTPGESPGHCAMRVTSVGEDFYALGDLVHHACEVEHPDWTLHASSHEDLQASRQRLFRQIAASDALTTFSHAHFPGWGRISDTGAGYRRVPAK